MSVPVTDAFSATVTVTPHESMLADDYTGARVEACPRPSGDCVPATCTDLSAACIVSGLDAGTQYSVTAVMVKGGADVSVKSAATTASPLHP